MRQLQAIIRCMFGAIIFATGTLALAQQPMAKDLQFPAEPAAFSSIEKPRMAQPTLSTRCKGCSSFSTGP